GRKHRLSRCPDRAAQRVQGVELPARAIFKPQTTRPDEDERRRPDAAVTKSFDRNHGLRAFAQLAETSLPLGRGRLAGDGCRCRPEGRLKDSCLTEESL